MKLNCEAIMKLRSQLCLAALGLCLVSPALAQDDKDKDKEKDKAAGAPARREESVRASVTAKVTAIDPAKRQITLKGAEGRERTLTVDKAVRRFDEIKVGDEVTADYYASLAAEVREPTADEKDSPLTEVEVGGRADKSSDPAAGGVRMVKAVTKVQSIDQAKKTVTIKGPRGNTHEIAVKDPATFGKLKEGDTIVITFTEAVAISLEKKE